MNEENNREPQTEEPKVINEEVNCVSREEVKNAVRRMKKGKAVGPDELPVEVWKCMGEMGIKFLTRLFNRLLMSDGCQKNGEGVCLSQTIKTKGWKLQRGGNTVLWKLQRNKANEPHNEGMEKNY